MTTWDAQYQAGQYRKYPNEMLVSWVARTYRDVPIGDRKSLLAVEFGCGAGANLLMLANEGFTVLGIDAAETAILYAKTRGLPAIRRDVRQTMLKADSVDLVVDVTCLQHLAQGDHFLALAEAHRILRRGGRLWSYRLGFGTHFDAIFPNNPPIWSCSKDELLEQLKAVGFVDLKILERRREYERAKWACYFEVTALRPGK